MRGIDQWRARLGWGMESDDNPVIEPLTPDAARTLRLPWLSRFSPQTLSRHVSMYPGMGLYVPTTGEYIVAESWRRREDIATIIELTSRKGRAALVRRLLNDLKGTGHRLAMVSDELWRYDAKFLADLGFSKLQTIVFFEKHLSREAVAALENPGFPDL